MTLFVTMVPEAHDSASPASVVPLTREHVPSGNAALHTDVHFAKRKVIVSSSAGSCLLTATHNTKPPQKQLEIATEARDDVMSQSAPIMSIMLYQHQ